MHTDLSALLHCTQHHYLSQEEMGEFKNHIAQLRQRLEVYELLREQEIAIFQPIADQLEEAFSETNPQVLERALQHWISVMRYCSMAMLLNNSEYLQRRLLEWLTDIVQAHQLQEIEQYLYEFLQLKLSEMLTAEQLALLNPFLEEARNTLLREENKSQSEMETQAEALF